MIDVGIGGERGWEPGKGVGYSDPVREEVRVESRAVKSAWDMGA